MPPCITCLYRHSENQNVFISLSLGWKQLCSIVLNLIRKPASEIYRGFATVVMLAICPLFWIYHWLERNSWYFIAEIIWQTKVKYKFCPGLEDYQDFFVINQDRIENLSFYFSTIITWNALSQKETLEICVDMKYILRVTN